MPRNCTTLRRWIAIFAMMAVFPCVALSQDRIEQIRQDANAPDSPPTEKKSNGNSKDCNSSLESSSSSDYFGEYFGNSLFYVALRVAGLPFFLPQHYLKDDLDKDRLFPPYPYAGDLPGYLWRDRPPNPLPDLAPVTNIPPTQWWTVRFSAEEGNDFHGLNRVGLRAVLDTSVRFGLQTNWNYVRENLGGGLHDETVLGDTNLIYRFAQSEKIEWYSGLGVRVLTDPHTTNWGGNFVYGIDYFPKKPWVFSSLIDAGNVGSAGVFHTRATVGVTMTHFELFGGYDYMRIGSVNVQGPVVGLRLWF